MISTEQAPTVDEPTRRGRGGGHRGTAPLPRVGRFSPEEHHDSRLPMRGIPPHRFLLFDLPDRKM